MKIMVILWMLAMGFILSPSIYDAYVWYQIEQQALVADLVEGVQE